MKLFSVLLLLAFGIIAPAHGAVLKTLTSLNGPRVYLRDLFDDAGTNADRVLGPGPAPGGRIVVETGQLKAIARQYGVNWQPASAGDRAVLDWPGRPLKRDDALAAVRTALVAQGAARDCDVSIPGFTPPLVPASGESGAIVTQLDYDHDQGRFVAVLSVSGGGMQPFSVRVSGEVSDVIVVPVAVIRLSAGAVAGPDDVRMARVHVDQVHAEVVRDPAGVIGKQLKRQIQAGVPIALADLQLPTQIARGEPVRLQLQVGELSLTGEGTALESGATGDRIRVRNNSSQAVIRAEVVSPGVVRVIPGTTPITAQARSGIPSARGG